MAVYPNGWTYVSGPAPRMIWSTTSSTATFKAFNPVTLSDDHSVIEAASDTTTILGIAQHDAAQSLGGIRANQILVALPQQETVYAVKIENGESASALSIGMAYGIEKSGNYLRPDPDSRVTPHVVLVGRDNGTLIDSTDSSVFVRFLGDSLGLYTSAASIANWAQD